MPIGLRPPRQQHDEHHKRCDVPVTAPLEAGEEFGKSQDRFIGQPEQGSRGDVVGAERGAGGKGGRGFSDGPDGGFV